ncbi:MAG TPA: PP2C family protein-serine/threonine phosphatase, partial [Candidatus Dormibacteraeota bacterium]|nr:PP2C family protein-serine/threonine phosphatase [Candidatus Dormibacteraeota bacterium]
IGGLPVLPRTAWQASFLLLSFVWPLWFAYAVVKHRVLEIPVLLKRSARFVLVQRGYFVFLFAVAAVASPPFLVRSNGSVERLAATAMVLGLFEEWESDVCEVQISSGDVLVIYTDGITEANNSAREEFGEDRLLETIRASRALPVPQIVDAILAAAMDFSHREMRDDLTLVVGRGR